MYYKYRYDPVFPQVSADTPLPKIIQERLGEVSPSYRKKFGNGKILKLDSVEKGENIKLKQK